MVSDGGWILVAYAASGHRLSLRVEEREDGRLRIVELLLSDPGGLSGTLLRDLPLGAWEAQINAPEMVTLLRDRLAPGAQVSYDDLPFKHEMMTLDLGPMPRDADDAALELHFPSGSAGAAVAIPVEPALNLEGANSRAGKRPDAFYRAVADAYSWLAGHGRRPAVELAAINGVPPTTVHRWVKEARRRGLFGPGRRLFYYDPNSPEVQQWAARARSGKVSSWDLAHDPILRAWASRIRKGVTSPTESFYDPIMEACRARMNDESIPAKVRLREPLALLILLSPSPFRELEDDPQDDAEQTPGDAP
jgi:DNA-directed RNA polymerase specialized sigma24 family protein